jgi:adenosine deaminase
MDIDLIDEYELAGKYFHFTPEDFFQMNKNAVAHSFLDPEVKKHTEKAFF